MFDVKLNWDEFKDRVDASELSIKYIDKFGNYYLSTYKDNIEYICVLDKLYADDFENNYQDNATLI